MEDDSATCIIPKPARSCGSRPGSNHWKRQGQQYKWPHAVTTGSCTASKQMLQLNRASAAAGEDDDSITLLFVLLLLMLLEEEGGSKCHPPPSSPPRGGCASILVPWRAVLQLRQKTRDRNGIATCSLKSRSEVDCVGMERVSHTQTAAQRSNSARRKNRCRHDTEHGARHRRAFVRRRGPGLKNPDF